VKPWRNTFAERILDLETELPHAGTEGSNPAPSSGESRANLNFNGESQQVKTVGDELRVTFEVASSAAGPA
jgi:hypothetical protein